MSFWDLLSSPKGLDIYSPEGLDIYSLDISVLYKKNNNPPWNEWKRCSQNHRLLKKVYFLTYFTDAYRKELPYIFIRNARHTDG